MSTIARILEASGLATVTLSLVRAQAEDVRPPRCLHVEFPLGRPFGKPGDSEFQLRVLRAAFALLERTEGPVLEVFPEAVGAADADQPIACALPPRSDPTLPDCVDEAIGLRAAYERQLAVNGRTLIGRIVAADQIVDALTAFERVDHGAQWSEVPFPVVVDGPNRFFQAAFDIRDYYEEAALSLAGRVPSARGTEDWFYRETKTGALLKRLQRSLRDAGFDRTVWELIVPVRQREP